MQPLQQQHAYQCYPNLDGQRILRNPRESFYLKVLLERLEEKLYSPTTFVDICYVRGSDLEMIREQHNPSFVDIVPEHNSSNSFRQIRSSS